jgi:hypothetical protein
MSKSKLAALVLITVLGFGSTSALAAVPAKAGAKCSKAGQTQIVGNKKFTCTKSGSKLKWNKGVPVPAKATPRVSASSEPSATQVDASPTASASPSSAAPLVKFKNCTEVKDAGAAPLTKASTPELYELNAGLDRDKDGVACES